MVAHQQAAYGLFRQGLIALEIHPQPFQRCIQRGERRLQRRGYLPDALVKVIPVFFFHPEGEVGVQKAQVQRPAVLLPVLLQPVQPGSQHPVIEAFFGFQPHVAVPQLRPNAPPAFIPEKAADICPVHVPGGDGLGKAVIPFRVEMGLADAGEGAAMAGKPLGDPFHRTIIGGSVIPGANAVDELPGKECRPGRGTHRARGIGVGKHRALGRQPVQVGGAQQPTLLHEVHHLSGMLVGHHGDQVHIQLSLRVSFSLIIAQKRPGVNPFFLLPPKSPVSSSFRFRLTPGPGCFTIKATKISGTAAGRFIVCLLPSRL